MNFGFYVRYCNGQHLCDVDVIVFPPCVSLVFCTSMLLHVPSSVAKMPVTHNTHF